MVISEIFSSIDGESKRAGELATFIRSIGCPLRCKYCDSKYTWNVDDSCKQMSIDEIVNYCQQLGNKNITFTGGEPLIQPEADALIEALSKAGFEVSIETCGAVDFTDRFWFVNNDPNVWVCVDYKCYASGQTDKMLPIQKFAKLRPQDVLKFVVGSREDLDLAYDIINELRENFNCDCYVYLSPVFGEIKPTEIIDYMKLYNMQHKIRFQLQLHKFVWDPNMRGV